MARTKTSVGVVLLLMVALAMTSSVMAETNRHTTGTSSANSDVSDTVPTNTPTNMSMIGIDLGSRYSRVGVIRNETTNELEVIPNDDGALATPAYVTWDPLTGDPIVGERAKQQAILNPYNTVYDFKSLLGQSFDSNQVQTAIAQLPYAIVERDGKPIIQVQVGPGAAWREFSPEDIAAIVIARMKLLAEQHLGHQVADAVVTVPAYFNDDQRQAMRNAGAIAGLTFQRLTNEPTAAAIAHKIDKTAQGEQNVVVVDVGGGTLDVTLLSIDGGVFEVLALNRNILRVGGDAFDNRIMQHCITTWQVEHEIDVSTDPHALQNLRLEAERVKRTLSTELTATVRVEWTSPQANGNALVLTESISREMFEAMTEKLLEPLLSTLEEVLADGGLKKEEVDSIVFVGGSTRVPMVREMVSTFFGGKAPSLVADEEEAVVHGAAIQARILTGADGSTRDVIMCFTNLMQLSLGVETAGGVMHTVISRNSLYPKTRSELFTTRHRYQTTATIRIYEGQHLITKANRLLGQLQLTGLTPLADGTHTIEITFDVDNNSENLLVIAREVNTDVVATASIPLDQNSITSETLEAQLTAAEKAIEVESKIKEWVTQVLDGGDELALAEGGLELESIRRELAEADDAIVAAAVIREPVSSHDEL